MTAGGALTDAELARQLVTVGAATAASVRATALSQGVRTKVGFTDVVTVADEQAEAAMVDLLRRHRPADSVVGEEGASYEGSSGRAWVLDPVDGTWNYTRSSQRWCSAAALVVEEASVLGAVCAGGAGGTGGVWVGGRDAVATEDEVPLPPLTDRPLAEAQLLTYLHPPLHATAVGEAWRRLVGGVATLRMTGSGSLDATDVASGRAELSVQHSVPVWDSAPGEALVRSVGGTAARVEVAGVEWFLLGTPRAVTEAAALLVDR